MALLIALAAALALRTMLSLDALAPVVATLLFVLAAACSAIAWRTTRAALRTTCFDIAGVLTFVGVGISLLIEPDQMVRMIGASERSE